MTWNLNRRPGTGFGFRLIHDEKQQQQLVRRRPIRQRSVGCSSGQRGREREAAAAAACALPGPQHNNFAPQIPHLLDTQSSLRVHRERLAKETKLRQRELALKLAWSLRCCNSIAARCCGQRSLLGTSGFMLAITHTPFDMLPSLACLASLFERIRRHAKNKRKGRRSVRCLPATGAGAERGVRGRS